MNGSPLLPADELVFVLGMIVGMVVSGALVLLNAWMKSRELRNGR